MTRTTEAETARQAETIRKEAADAEPKESPPSLTAEPTRDWPGPALPDGRTRVALADLDSDHAAALSLLVRDGYWPAVFVGADRDSVLALAAATFCGWPNPAGDPAGEPTILAFSDLEHARVLPAATDSAALLLLLDVPPRDAPTVEECDEQARGIRAAMSDRRDEIIKAGERERLSYDELLARFHNDDTLERHRQALAAVEQGAPDNETPREPSHRARRLQSLLARRTNRRLPTVITSCGIECDYTFSRNWHIENVTRYGAALTFQKDGSVRHDVRLPRHMGRVDR